MKMSLLGLLLKTPLNRAGGKSIAAVVLAGATQTKELVDALFFPDTGVRALAATAVDHLSEQHADLLNPHVQLILDAAAEARGIARYLLARTLPRLTLTDAQVGEAAGVLRMYLATERKSRAARAFAASGLARLSLRDQTLRAEAATAVAAALLASPAERSQARRVQHLLDGTRSCLPG